MESNGPVNREKPGQEELEPELLQDLEGEDVEQINIDVPEDDLIHVHGKGWGIYLSPGEARLLAEALRDAADDAEGGVE
jgi:hypothetical protein